MTNKFDATEDHLIVKDIIMGPHIINPHPAPLGL
jgi:hypothetical protein